MCSTTGDGENRWDDHGQGLRLQRSRSGCTQLFGEASTIGGQRAGHQMEILDSLAAEISDHLTEASNPAVVLRFAF
jgi:hypothetical protein